MPYSGKAEILPIQSCDIGQYQKIAVPFIQSALEYTDGESTLKDTLDGIATQKKQLWLIKAGDEFIGGVVTQIYTTDSGMKIGEVTLAAGRNYPLWNHFTDVVGVWFKEMGCACVQVIGRPGWAKRLQGNGFNQRYTVLRKGL